MGCPDLQPYSLRTLVLPPESVLCSRCSTEIPPNALLIAELRLRFADTDRVRILRPKTLRVAETESAANNNAEPTTVHSDDVAPPDMLPYVAVGCEQTDSRVVWAEVTDAIHAEDWTRAKTAKRAVEVRAGCDVR